MSKAADFDFERDLVFAAKGAVSSYCELAKSINFVVPENWLQCKIAEYFFLERELFVVLEASSNKHSWDSRLTNPLATHELKRKGRPDLLLFDERSNASFVIEVKGVRTTWPSFAADAERIRELVDAKRVKAGALVYPSGLATKNQLDDENANFKKWTRPSEDVDKIHFERFPGPDQKYWQISLFVH